jgi:imidazolonepropionase-like amidohydrolase
MSQDLILKGATVVDTRSGVLRSNTAIVIVGGVIRDMLPGANAPEGTGYRTVDATGQFVIPGFNDMHSHALQDRNPEDTLAVMLAYGITGVRQLAGSSSLLIQRSEGRFAAFADAPEVLEVTGEILTRMNAKDPATAVAEVRKQKAEGADFIKVIDVDNQTFFAALEEANRQGLPFLGHVPPVVDAAEASRKGMRSVEHLGPAEIQLISCSSREWLVRLILRLKPPPALNLSPEAMAKTGRLIVANPVLFRANLDKTSFTKTQRLIDSFSEVKCRQLAKTFVDHNTWQVPTLIRLDTMQSADQARFTQNSGLRFVPASVRAFWAEVGQQFAAIMTKESRETLRKLMQLELKMTRIFDESGVKMLTGSDYGGGWVAPGVSLHEEFDLLADAGLSPLKILQMTTLLPAEFLHKQTTMGTVESGMHANLVLLSGNPIENARNLHNIEGVIRDGRFYSTADLEQLKVGVAERAVHL